MSMIGMIQRSIPTSCKNLQEFGRTINDPATIKEVDQNFTSDLFSDTYLHMELAIPREGGRVQLGLLVN